MHLAVRAAAGNPANCRSPARISPVGLPPPVRTAGYRNYHSGKWHIDGKILPIGFDRSLNMQNQGNFFTARGNSIDDVPVKVPADEKDYYATLGVEQHRRIVGQVEELGDLIRKGALTPRVTESYRLEDFKEAFEAITSRDFPVIQGFVIIIASIYVFVNLIVDVSYAFLDPRIRLE